MGREWNAPREKLGFISFQFMSMCVLAVGCCLGLNVEGKLGIGVGTWHEQESTSRIEEEDEIKFEES